MKRHTNYIPITIRLCFGVLCGPVGGYAATLWNGPAITFTKADGTDPTQATNQDRMTSHVWITRGDCQGI